MSFSTASQAWTRVLMISLLLLFVTGGPVVAAKTVSETTLKAALVYKLTKFVEWPPTRMNDVDSFHICTFGDNVLNGAMSSLAGKRSHGLPIRVFEDVRSVSDMTSCHLLFVKSDTTGKRLLQELEGQPILVISDAPQFAENGGDIAIRRVRKRYRFIINLTNVKARGLKIAAPLLQLSTVINRPAP